QVMIGMLLADGQIDDEEVKMLQAHYREITGTELPEDEILARFLHDTTTVSTLDSGTNRSQASMGDAPVRWVSYLVGLGVIVLVVAWWQGRVPDLETPFATSETVESASTTTDASKPPETASGSNPEAPAPYVPPAPLASGEAGVGAEGVSTGLTSEEMAVSRPGESAGSTSSPAEPVTRSANTPAERDSDGDTSGQRDSGISAEAAGEASDTVLVERAPRSDVSADEASPTESLTGSDPGAAASESTSTDGPATPEAATSVSTASSVSAPSSTQAAPGAGSTPANLEIGDVGRDRLTLRFDGDCWTSVVDGADRRLIYRLIKGGSVIEVKGDAPFRVTLGNSDAVAVALNGEDFDHTPFSRANIARFTVGGPR
ncbi:MAG: RodZ domain-containing protein, partial [Gammaproteobacteria bacterium]